MFRPKGTTIVGLVVALTVISPLTAVKGASPQELLSPRLIALQKEIQAGNRAALESFWQEVAKQGTPLVEPIPGDAKHVWVTFLWRAKEEVKNVVVFSWFGYYHGRFEIARNQMTHLPGTDLWYRTYGVPNDARSSYRLSPNDSLVPLEEVKPEDWSRRTAAWQADPLNAHRHFYPRNEEWRDDVDVTRSVAELPAAPRQPWTQPQPGVPAGRVELHRLKSEILGNERRVWVYTPAGYKPGAKPYHLLVLFDGWWYLQWMSTPTTLDNLTARAGLLPVVAVMIDEPTLKDRILDLGCYSPFNVFLEKELIPWIRQHYRVASNPAETIVAGLSRGGLAAGCAALEHPEIFGNVLSQSGYFSWKSGPDENEEENDAEYGWLIRQYATRMKLPVQFYLDVGRFESDYDGLLFPNRHMRDVLQAQGYTMRYAEFSGGHDFACWQGTLADGLLALLGRQNGQRLDERAAHRESAEEHQTMNRLPRPAPEMEKLSKMFVGFWSTSEKHEPWKIAPKGGTGKGSDTVRHGPGGMSLISDYKSTDPMGKFIAHGIIWWDAKEQGYKGVECQNRSPVGCEVGSIWKWEGNDLVSHEEGLKEAFTDITPTSHTFYMDASTDHGTMSRVMTIHYSKIAGTGAPAKTSATVPKKP